MPLLPPILLCGRSRPFIRIYEVIYSLAPFPVSFPPPPQPQVAAVRRRLPADSPAASAISGFGPPVLHCRCWRPPSPKSHAAWALFIELDRRALVAAMRAGGLGPQTMTSRTLFWILFLWTHCPSPHFLYSLHITITTPDQQSKIQLPAE